MHIIRDEAVHEYEIEGVLFQLPSRSFPFSSLEATLLLVSTKNRDFWKVQFSEHAQRIRFDSRNEIGWAEFG